MWGMGLVFDDCFRPEADTRKLNLTPILVFPEQRVVVVITTTNYDVQQPHRITAKLLMEKILPAL